MTVEELADAQSAADAAAAAAGLPSSQVNPYKDNPNMFARYQILQSGREVGWVLVAGESSVKCQEHWQLFKHGITGDGEKLPDGSIPKRAAYVWVSQDNGEEQGADVVTRFVYKGATDGVHKPTGTETTDYYQVTADCSPA